MKELQTAPESSNNSDALSLIPTVDIVVFPQMVVPLLVMDQRIIDGVNKALEGSKEILLVAVRGSSDNTQKKIESEDLYEVGTIGKIMRVMNIPEGGMKILAQGLRRVSIEKIYSEDDSISAVVREYPFESQTNNPMVEKKVREIIALCEP